MGLNVKKQHTNSGFNVCFSPVVIRENTLSKPFTRRWFPLGGPHKFIASIHNTKLTISDGCERSTKFSIEFINAHGDLLTREVDMNSNGSLFIDISKDTELDFFFTDQVGWCMINAETYLVDAYYFSTVGEQIGGGHAY